MYGLRISASVLSSGTLSAKIEIKHVRHPSSCTQISAVSHLYISMLQWHSWVVYGRIISVYQYCTDMGSFISVSALGFHRHLWGVNRCISPVSNTAKETCCSCSPRSRQHIILISLQARKKGETFVNKSLFIFCLFKMCLWTFLQSKQCNHFTLHEGQFQSAGEEGWQIVLNICSMRREYVRCRSTTIMNIQTLYLHREKD